MILPKLILPSFGYPKIYFVGFIMNKTLPNLLSVRLQPFSGTRIQKFTQFYQRVYLCPKTEPLFQKIITLKLNLKTLIKLNFENFVSLVLKVRTSTGKKLIPSALSSIMLS